MRLLVPLFLFAFAGLFTDAAVTETIEATHTVTADASFSLENINGTVSIDTWDRSEIRIVAVKEARTQEDLDAIEVKIQADDDHVAVKTEYNRKEGSFLSKWTNSGDVTYSVTVPHGASLRKVRTVNGSVHVENVGGTVDVATVNGSIDTSGLRSDANLETVNGNVKARFASVSDNQSIEIGSVNGRSEIVLPEDANCGIKARTVHGGIRTDFDLEVDKRKYGPGSRLN
ncbi:MAG TPA: DUF4097 family beta strand repeat-containing protein, partial [Opitutaceae bacterium]|nr:DUF4097 family beta strand repeat-containing protein [Opitutaceae bacterium]